MERGAAGRGEDAVEGCVSFVEGGEEEGLDGREDGFSVWGSGDGGGCHGVAVARSPRGCLVLVLFLMSNCFL